MADIKLQNYTVCVGSNAVKTKIGLHEAQRKIIKDIRPFETFMTEVVLTDGSKEFSLWQKIASPDKVILLDDSFSAICYSKIFETDEKGKTDLDILERFISDADIFWWFDFMSEPVKEVYIYQNIEIVDKIFLNR